VAAIWIVSEESTLAAILAHHVGDLGETWLGTPERDAFKDAPPADLLLLVAATETGGRTEVLERLLAFVRQIPTRRRVPAPVLFVAAQAGGAALARLFDDRVASALEFPFDPDELSARAALLLAGGESPASLRERARQLWVRAEVERQYAGLDLPALRQAVDPRGAHRPVLFLGEPGTRRGLLARYVHIFAEPARDDFVLISLADVAPGELERTLLARTAGRRTSVYLPRLERAPRALQEELAHLLGASGALAVEPIRWLAAAVHPASLASPLRELSWLRVTLPPLRARSDRAQLIAGALRAASERQGRELSLSADARELLESYPWPANLEELDRALDDAVAGALGPEIRSEDLARLPRRSARAAPAPAPQVAPPQTAPVAETVAPRAPEIAPDLDVELEPEPEPEPLPERVVRAEPEPEARLGSDEDLMLATFAPASDMPTHAPEMESESEPEIELEDELEPGPLPAPAQMPAAPSLRDILAPLAQEIRKPLRAVRTYASLVEQRPNDVSVRRELRTLVEEDLGGVDETLQRVERFVRFGAPSPRPFDLAAALASELDARHSLARARELVVLRELDFEAPPLVADEAQIRFAIGALLDRALRLVPRGGDVYLGSSWNRKRDERPAGHRILLRFHSPEDVLAGPLDDPDAAFVEVVMARDLFGRAGGTFAVDASGPQDNVILVELPG
jgi:DNA-binding NtrC family response regulator